MSEHRQSRRRDGGESPGSSSWRWGVVALWLAAGAMLVLGVQSAVRLRRASTTPSLDAVPSGPLTFSKDVAPIIFGNCSTCHHPGDAAPFALLSYADVRKRARQIVEVTSRRLMPPWLPAPGYNEFVGQRYLTPREIALIQQWVEQGAPEGDPAETPSVPAIRDGWQLGQPDLVIQLAQPYALVAEGKDVYRNFVVPVPGDGRRYVRAVANGSGRRVQSRTGRPQND